MSNDNVKKETSYKLETVSDPKATVAKWMAEYTQGVDEVNTKQVAKALDDLYKLHGMKAPTHVIYHDSPLDFHDAHTEASKTFKTLTPLINEFFFDPKDEKKLDDDDENVYANVCSEIRKPIINRLHDLHSIHNDFFNTLINKRHTEDQEYGSFKDLSESHMINYIRLQLYVQDLAVYEAYPEEFKKLEPFVRLFLAGVGGITLYKECILLWRRVDVHVNDNFELSNTDGPAYGYRAKDRNECKVFYIEGVKINDEKIIKAPHTQTLEEINKEEDIEIKRIRIERYGWIKFLEEMNAKEVHSRTNDIDGTKEVLMSFHSNDEDMKVLVSTCRSTARMYVLEVPPASKTCEEAQNFLSEGLASRTIGAS